MGKIKDEDRIFQIVEVWSGPKEKLLLCFSGGAKPGFNPWCKILYKENDSTVRIELENSDSEISNCSKYKRIASFKRKDHNLVDYRKHIVTSMMGGNSYFKQLENS
jgi:hypothetical protein